MTSYLWTLWDGTNVDVIWECKELWYQISRYKHIVYCIYHVNQVYKLFAIVYFLGKKCEIKQKKYTSLPASKNLPTTTKKTLHLHHKYLISQPQAFFFPPKKKKRRWTPNRIPTPKKKTTNGSPSHSRLSELDAAAAAVFAAGWGAGKAASEGGTSWSMAMGGNHNGPGKLIKIHPAVA